MPSDDPSEHHPWEPAATALWSTHGATLAAALSPRFQRMSLRRTRAVSCARHGSPSLIELPAGLWHESALGVCQDEIFEHCYRLGLSAAGEKQLRQRERSRGSGGWSILVQGHS